MKNDFRQLVDRNLSGLRWDETRQARVLRALEPEGGTSMKRKMTVSLALAAALVMLASVALAAAVLNYSPAANAKKLATQAMYDTYGFDRSTLGLLQGVVTADGVRYYPDSYLPVERIGEYLVKIDGETVTATWSHDDKDAVLWQSGDPAAPVWGVKQLAAYLAVDPGERGDWLAAYTVTALPMPAATPVPETMAGVNTVAQEQNDLPLAQAMAYADAALMDVYGMTEGEVAAIDHDVDARVIVENARRIWSLTYGDGEGMYYIKLDAATGEILDIGMSTGGNG